MDEDKYKGLSDDDFINELNEKKDESRIILAMENKIKDEELEIHQQKKKNATFNIDEYLKTHINFDLLTYIPFNYSELVELSDIIATKINWRGMNSSYTISTQLFIAFIYFSSNITIDKISPRLNVPRTTFHRIIQLVVRKYFPIFNSEFLPQKIIPTENYFKNYPSAVGALDTTTVPHYTPLRRSTQKQCFDYKHKKNGAKIQLLVNADGIAIHCQVEANSSIHDKKLFDQSPLKDLLIQKNGCEIETKRILADKGYLGIEKDLPKALIMKKGDSEEIKEINNRIAQDRQIVERFNGRFKKIWNIASTGCRLDRLNIPDILTGLVGLTNYHIRHHPLNDDDLIKKELTEKIDKIEFDNGKKNVTFSYEPIFKANFNINKTSDLDTYASRKIMSPNPGFSFRNTSQFIGLHNQGNTCHLNVALQILFSFTCLQDIIKKNARNNTQPSLEIHNIFLILFNKKIYNSYAGKTNTLTKVLNDEKWTQQQPIDFTLFNILNEIKMNCMQNHFDDISLLYQFSFVDKNTNTEHCSIQLIFKKEDNTILQSIKKLMKNDTKFKSGELLFVNISRDKELKMEIPLEYSLDFSSISDQESPKEYNLKIIVGYNGNHYVLFKLVEGKWFLLNDAYCYLVENELIDGLKGGTSIECTNLRKRMNNMVWVSCFLVYYEKGKELYY